MSATDRSLNDHVRQALAEGADAVQRLESLLKGQRRQDLSVDTLLRLRTDIDALAAVLGQVADRIDEAELAEALEDPLGEAWWSRARRELATADDRTHRTLWGAKWVEALAADRYDRADQIADMARSSADRRLQDRMREVTAAFAIRRRADALPALVDLVNGAEALPSTVAVPLVVLRARIHLRATGDTSAAVDAARDAVNRTSENEPDSYALALAVLAEAHLQRGELDAAATELNRTRSLPATVPDPLVVAGMLAERRGSWRLVNELYDEAADRAGAQAARPQLMRPTPANVLWRVARQLRAREPAKALAFVEEAVSCGIVGKGACPERQAYVDKGRILKALGRHAEAAEAYREAADRYLWSDQLPRAVGLYEQAYGLAPDDAMLRWKFAEALRLQIEDDDTVVDEGRARHAYQLVHDGLAEKPPGEGEAWVLGTEALLAFSLRDPEADPALLLERALLLDETSARVHAFLAVVLRLSGYPAEAEAPARQSYERDPRDPVAADVLAAVLADIGDPDAALEVIERFVEPRSGTVLPLREGMLHLQNGNPRAALAAVAAETPSGMVHLIRGLAHEMTRESAAAIAEYEKVWSDPTGSMRNRAWARYRAGHLDEAIALLTELADRRPRDPSFALDLGLMLVVRGDLDSGGRTLRDAVDACTVVGDLSFFVEVDLPASRAGVAGQSHEQTAVSLFDDVADRAGRRCAAVRASTRPSESAAVRAARARATLAAGHYEESIGLYRELVQDDAVPEARHGLSRAARALLERGDDLLANRNDVVGAQAAWTGALRGVTAPDPLADRLRTRIALLVLEEGDGARIVEDVRSIFQTASNSELQPAMKVVARDVPSAWRLRNRLQGAVNRAAADCVPLAIPYQLKRDAVPESAVFPLITPVEVRMTPRLAGLVDAPRLDETIPELRRRLAVETGVRIPGVRVVALEGDTAVEDVSFWVYDQLVDRMSSGEPVDAPLITGRLERAVRANLYRLISPDDVTLWLDGWDDDEIEPVDGRVIDAPSRLRLVRVLRLLLREGVAITDRVAIVKGIQAAEREGSPGPFQSMRVVRRGLSLSALGHLPGMRLEPVPERLEHRVQGGLDPDRSSWAMERALAIELVDDMQSWRAGLPDTITATVRDPNARPFVWRLLVSAGLRTPVLAEEEVG